MTTSTPPYEQALVTLRTRVANHFDAARSRQPSEITCVPGCDACCQPGLSVFGLEAKPIQALLQHLEHSDQDLRAIIRSQGQRELENPETAVRCALLVDGKCSVYEARPLICRSHGLAVYDPQSKRVESCTLNYQTAPPVRESILNVDALNLPLSVAAELCQREEGGTLRYSLAELAAADPQRVPGSARLR